MAFRLCSKLVLCHCIRVGWWGGIQAVQQACCAGYGVSIANISKFDVGVSRVMLSVNSFFSDKSSLVAVVCMEVMYLSQV